MSVEKVGKKKNVTDRVCARKYDVMRRWTDQANVGSILKQRCDLTEDNDPCESASEEILSSNEMHVRGEPNVSRA